MMYYRDDQFAEKVGAKLGTIRCFKRIMREKGKIGLRGKMNDDDIKTFERALEWHKMTNSTLEQAFKLVISGSDLGLSAFQEGQSNIEQFENQIAGIVNAIDEIENIWPTIPDDVSDDLMDGYPTQLGSLEDVSDALKKWMVHIQKVKIRRGGV